MRKFFEKLQEITQEYSHSPGCLTQEKVATEIKEIRGNYPIALNTGSQSSSKSFFLFLRHILRNIK